MGNKNSLTAPFGNKWAVKKEGTKEPVSTHHTEAAAQQKRISLAKKAQVEHVIHSCNGIIQDKDSYGNDPCPPRYRKH